jgi:hypothetical protein
LWSCKRGNGNGEKRREVCERKQRKQNKMKKQGNG